MGWRILPLPKRAKKCVMIMAPHTSNYDFYIGLIGFWSLGVKAKMLIKKEAFKFPIGFFLKKLGGVPVDRQKKTNMITRMSKLYNGTDEMVILFTPEGTRSYNENWKKGFYYMAKEAQVPIVIGYLDFKNKVGGFLPDFNPTWDEEKDLETIKKMYRDAQVMAKHPDKSDISVSP